MTQNKFVGFCYAFIVGIAGAMAFTLGPQWVGRMWWLTALLAVATVGVFVALRKKRPPEENLSPWGVLPFLLIQMLK